MILCRCYLVSTTILNYHNNTLELVVKHGGLGSISDGIVGVVNDVSELRA